MPTTAKCVQALVSAVVLVCLLAAMAAAETLLVIEPTPQQPRNSEGDLIELKDGRLCLIYTRFTGGASDNAAADLAMRTSADDGKTWSEDKIVVPSEGGCNVMSVSLLRLANGEIALFYLRKTSLSDCRPILRISRDEAETFSEPTVCIADEVGYYVLNNDRAVQLSGGRLVLPVALHNQPGWEKPDWAGTIMCYLSDDNGKTWRWSKGSLVGKRPGGRITFQEPGVVELKDGRLMMFIRTDGGSQFLSYSADGGETWTEAVPSALASPVSPATIERIPWSGELLCVWNDHSGAHPFPKGRRTPLCAAISDDEGQTWGKSRVIEDEPDGWYCYTAMAFHKDRVLLAYCAGDRHVGGLSRLKVRSLSKDWLRQCADEGRLGNDSGALLDPCLDYGRSFVNTKAVWNSPRFWVESRCRIVDPKAGVTEEYWQCGSCKSENTFGESNLLLVPNYDFLPIFGQRDCVVFRRHAQATEGYRSVIKIEDAWGGVVPCLRRFRGRVLASPDDVRRAIDAGQPIIAQTELRDEGSGRTAVLEYSVKTINWHREKKIWQVDTGPVAWPDLSVPADQWSEKLQLAYVVFRAPDWADVVIEQPTPVMQGETKIGEVYHYSGIQHVDARNVLIACEEP